MKKTFYGVLFIIGLMLAVAESSTIATNLIGLVVMVATSIKAGLINIKEILNK